MTRLQRDIDLRPLLPVRYTGYLVVAWVAQDAHTTQTSHRSLLLDAAV